LPPRRSQPSRDPAPESFRPSKRFGQNFLADQSVIQRIISALEPRSDETIVEIGPGKGALTSSLVERSGSVVAIEFDKNLIPILTERFKDSPSFRLLEDDALTIDFCEAIRPATSARLVANLPYNVATAILQKLIAQRRCIPEMVVMLQKEVVDRITAAPGSGDYGTLAIQVSRVADVERLLTLPPGAFRPPPKVTSAVVRLRFRPPSVDVGDTGVFEKVVRGIFLQRRKTLANALKPVADALGQSADKVVERAEVDGRRRPETLSLAEIARICRAML